MKCFRNLNAAHRSSCISHPDSEISIKMTAGQSDEDDLRSPTPRPTRSPLPNTDRLRSILASQNSLPVFANPTSVGFAANGFTRSIGVRQPPPPIPPRRQPLLMNGATFSKVRSSAGSMTIHSAIRPGIGRQLPNPAHLPGMAIRRHLPPPIPPHRQTNAAIAYKQSPKIIANPLSSAADFARCASPALDGSMRPLSSSTNRRLITNPFLNEYESEPLQTFVRSPPGISCVGGSLGSSVRHSNSSGQFSDEFAVESPDDSLMQRSVSFETPLISTESAQRRSVLYQGRCGSSLDSQSPLYLNLSGPPVPPHHQIPSTRPLPAGTVSQPDSAVTSPEHVIRSACSDDDILHEQERFRQMDHKQLVDYIENLKESCA
jgi:hypothetical protein